VTTEQHAALRAVFGNGPQRRRGPASVSM